MRRALLLAAFFVVLGVALGALYYTQRHNKQAPVSPTRFWRWPPMRNET